ncbi:MAG: NTP transferase domain-containing protein [Candidatus Obscuribacterales bacterium]|nr:NTP transferase domain-containing protein [Candidatus Obscuribacterales bacterium]
MNDIELVRSWTKYFSTHEQQPAVLCTVVKTRGSAYRSPGAKMLVFADGSSAGIVSGGCLESDLRHRSSTLLASDRQSEVVWYDTSRDDDILFGSGTGCSGETILLLEKINTIEPHVSSDQPKILCRVFESSNPDLVSLQSLLLEPEIDYATATRAGSETANTRPFDPGSASILPASISNSDIIAQDDLGATPCVPRRNINADENISNSFLNTLKKHATEILATAKSEIRNIELDGFSVSVFFEYLAPPIQLSIFGAGADAVPLVELARNLGWQVTVFDWRPAFAKPERFAAGTSVHCLPFDDLQKAFESDSKIADAVHSSASLIMSHSLSNDLAALRFLSGLRSSANIRSQRDAGAPNSSNSSIMYLGVLGPKKRTERLLEELSSEQNARINQANVHYPAGLDIGAEDPTEIAIAIIAEITAIVRRRKGGFLKDRNAPIHDQICESTEEFPIVSSTYISKFDLKSPYDRVQAACEINAVEKAEMRVGAIILAAGKAERFGSAKQLLEFNGRSLIENAIAAADGINCDPVLVVTGAYHYEILEHIASLENQHQLKRIEIRQNSNWKRGIGGSITLGTHFLKDRVDAIVVIACDQPFVNSEILKDMVMELNRETNCNIVASKYEDTFGIPALFRAPLFDQLLKLPSNKGAKQLIQENLTMTYFLDFPKGAIDIDTAQDYQSLLASL